MAPQLRERDPAERHAQEAALRRENQKLRDEEQARRLFLRAASHELRGPLTPLLMQLQMALKSDLDAPVRQSLQTALKNAERLEALASDLANVGRTAMGFEIEKRHLDLQGVLQEAAATFQVPAAVKDIDLQVQLDGPVPVQGDHQRLVQVAGNLLNNAIRFTPRAGKIRLAAWTQQEQACFSVTDSGPGVPEDQREHLFKPFEQLHTAAVDGGSGLGLFICRNIVAAHGGHIEASHGSGATFIVRLPVD